MRSKEKRTDRATRTNVDLQHVWPTETCPVCGKKWVRFCRRDEWGYYYNSSPSQIESWLTLLCSAECAKKYAEEQLMKRVRKVAKTKACRALKLAEQNGMTILDAMKAIGMNHKVGLRGYQDEMWQEIEWLRAHNWEVPT